VQDNTLTSREFLQVVRLAGGEPFQTGRLRHRRPACAHRERFLARRDGSMTSSKMMRRASGHHAARICKFN
jgi:hypothetical protein